MPRTSLYCLIALLLVSASFRSELQAESTVSNSAKPKVTITKKGDEPRSPLRYNLKQGDSQPYDLKLGTSMQVQGNNIDLPTQTIKSTAKVTKVNDGEVTLSSEIVDIEVGDGLPQVVQAMKDATAELKGLKTVATITPRGEVVKSETDLSSIKNEQIKQQLASTLQAMEQVSTVLPEEAVGVGAVWTVLQTVSTNGADVLQNTEYKLTERDGQTVTLEVTITQSAENQKFSPPNLPPGSTATMKKLDTKGTGKMTINTNSAIPVSSTMDLKTETTVEVTVNGQTQTVDVTAEITMEISPGK